MQLFYSSHREGDYFYLDAEEARHMYKVLRKEVGDFIQIMDGQGGRFTCSIEQISKTKCVLKIEEIHPLDSHRGGHIHIGLAPTKNNARTEWFLEKATELGLGKCSFFSSQHSERIKIRLDRLEKIVLSASKQSYNLYLPVLEELQPLKKLLEEAKDFKGNKYIAYCGEEFSKQPLKSLYKGALQPTMILIGPEGDFTPSEVELAQEYDFQPITLGTSRLRTETAALIAVHSIHLLDS